PDAGIQRYYKYTTFDKKGKLVSEEVENYDGPGQIPKLIVPNNPNPKPKREPIIKTKEKQPVKPEKKNEPQKEIVECAVMHKNEVEVINHTRTKIEITFIYQNKDTTFLLKQGESANGATYISAEVSSPVNQNMTFRYEPKRKRKNVVKLLKTNQIEQYKTKHVIHLFERLLRKLRNNLCK
ncbi:MAG: hypothetical protein WED10_12625, partial [Brumimicrobium sp.]